MNKKIFVFSLILSLGVFAITADDAASLAFVEGCTAYSKGDWTSAILSFRKATSYNSNNNPETYYMLINAEMYIEDYKNALDDCEWFLENFENSLYDSNVLYMKGRCLYALGEYDKAVIVLSDFCHQYEDNDMYAAALFWIGECFYACYQYDDALALYQRVVVEFPGDQKAPAAQYRIETISQRDREEKLLYLLKQTGEEYLFAKEEYEKQIKLSSPTTTSATTQRLYDAEEKYRELQEKYGELEKQLDDIKSEDSNGDENYNSALVRQLKQKAAETKILLDYMNDDIELGGLK